MPLPPRTTPSPFVVSTDGNISSADSCYLLDASATDGGEHYSEVARIAKRKGLPVLDLLQGMYRISGLLDRHYWDGDTLDAIADVVRNLGFLVRDVG
jgi:hypothetical protein